MAKKMKGASKDYFKLCKTLQVECANGSVLQKDCTGVALLIHRRILYNDIISYCRGLKKKHLKSCSQLGAECGK